MAESSEDKLFFGGLLIGAIAGIIVASAFLEIDAASVGTIALDEACTDIAGQNATFVDRFGSQDSFECDLVIPKPDKEQSGIIINSPEKCC
jgi:hypothetical protein